MSYIRIKKIRTKRGEVYPYAYLVENRYSKRAKGARQKIIGYLGRIYGFHKVKEKPIRVESFLKNRRYRDSIVELAKRELLNHGFVVWNEVYRKDDIEITFGDGIHMTKNYKSVRLVLQMNEGFLCTETFDRLTHFRANGDESATGKEFAHALVGAGISVPEELFVEMVQNYFSRV